MYKSAAPTADVVISDPAIICRNYSDVVITDTAIIAAIPDVYIHSATTQSLPLKYKYISKDVYMYKPAATTADVAISDTAIIAADLDVYTHSATTLSLSLLYIYKDVS